MSAVNFNDPNACKSAYLNFYYGGNTKGISKDDITEIEKRYQSQLKGWKVEASKDQNAYEIEDDNDNQRKASSRSKADLFGAAATSVGGVLATRAANQAAINGITKAGGTFVNGTPAASAMGTQTFSEVGVGPTSDMASKANNTSAIGFMVECTLGLATGTLYQASKPNKDEHKELMELESQMQEYLGNIESEQEVMAEDADTLQELGDEAESIGEDSAESLEELKKQYDEKVARQEELAAKIESGQPLTEEEKAEYEQLGEDISALGEKMSELSEDSTDEIEDVTEETETVQEDLETTADTVETIQDKADYAESFDKDTKTMCIMESVAQGLNVASSTKGAVSAFTFAQSGAMLFGSTLWANAFGAMGVAGAAMSAVGVVEQAKMASDISGEIDIRKEVQSLNTELADVQEATSETLDEVSDSIEDVASDVEDSEVPAEGEEPPVVPTGEEEPLPPEKDEDLEKEDEPTR